MALQLCEEGEALCNTRGGVAVLLQADIDRGCSGQHQGCLSCRVKDGRQDDGRAEDGTRAVPVLCGGTGRSQSVRECPITVVKEIPE